MTNIGWIILLILLVPAVGLLLWVFLASSFVRIPPGEQAVVLVRGRATDKTLGPGWHFVPALVRRLVARYPAVELCYRAGGAADEGDRPGLDVAGPAIPVVLGDRTETRMAVTVRFRLMPSQLRLVHERFGPGGYFGIVRDETAIALRAALGASDVGVDDLFSEARIEVQQRVAAAVADRLATDGIEVALLGLGAIDLGRTGEVIQAISRARHELEQENVGAATRLARARHDGEQAEEVGGEASALTYRELELWPDVARSAEHLHLSAAPGSAYPLLSKVLADGGDGAAASPDAQNPATGTASEGPTP